MRILKEITRPDCKITLYAWNNRYLIKVEQGLLEQTFKVNEYDVSEEADIEKMLDAAFLTQTLQRFEAMAHSLHSALQRI
jgi:hypothetical protein